MASTAAMAAMTSMALVVMARERRRVSAMVMMSVLARAAVPGCHQVSRAAPRTVRRTPSPRSVRPHIASASSKAGTGCDTKVGASTARGVAGCKWGSRSARMKDASSIRCEARASGFSGPKWNWKDASLAGPLALYQ